MDVSSDSNLLDEKDENITLINQEKKDIPSKLRPGNRHRKVECKVCLRTMHSNNLKRHILKHRELYMLDEGEIRNEIKRRKILHETREEREKLLQKIAQEEGYHAYDAEKSSPSTIEKELMNDEQVYTRKIEYGKTISTILEKGVIREESLSKDNMEALKIFRKQMTSNHLVQPTQLRQWQETLVDSASLPTNREVIWIIGRKGDEGKTWLQSYMESFFGYARVVRLDLKMKTANVLHVLTKRSLSTTDIFLFDVPRAITHETCNYYILESIKDGIAVSSKYNNDIIRFKVPNVVIVFSNSSPNTTELSKDRWKIFQILKDELKDVTADVWKAQH